MSFSVNNIESNKPEFNLETVLANSQFNEDQRKLIKNIASNSFDKENNDVNQLLENNQNDKQFLQELSNFSETVSQYKTDLMEYNKNSFLHDNNRNSQDIQAIIAETKSLQNLSDNIGYLSSLSGGYIEQNQSRDQYNNIGDIESLRHEDFSEKQQLIIDALSSPTPENRKKMSEMIKENQQNQKFLHEVHDLADILQSKSFELKRDISIQTAREMAGKPGNDAELVIQEARRIAGYETVAKDNLDKKESELSKIEFLSSKLNNFSKLMDFALADKIAKENDFPEKPKTIIVENIQAELYENLKKYQNQEEYIKKSKPALQNYIEAIGAEKAAVQAASNKIDNVLKDIHQEHKKRPENIKDKIATCVIKVLEFLKLRTKDKNIKKTIDNRVNEVSKDIQNKHLKNLVSNGVAGKGR